MRCLVIALGVLLAGSPVSAETFGPYLGDVTETAASIAWRTETAGTSIVEFEEGVMPPTLSSTETDPTMVEQHELRLTGLQPGATYTYRVRSEAAGQTLFESGPHTFRTAAPRGAPFSFVFFAEVHEELEVAGFDPVVAAFDPWFQIQVGDNIDDADALDQFESFFTQGAWYSSVPLFNAFGNHNYQHDDGGLIPTNTDAALSLELMPPHERWYTFRYGDTQFFALDSSHYLSDDTRDMEPAWFEQVLSEARDGVDDPALMVAFFHIPVHSSCGELGCRTRKLVENPWVERELISRIEQYGVHLVMNGHDKINEHSVVNGVHYLQVSSGASPRELGANNPGSQWADADGLGMGRITVNGCMLSFDVVRPDSTVLHSGTVTGDCNLLPVDADMDGVPASMDCDDGDPARFPGNAEVCGDGIDQDCSGADEDCPMPDAGVAVDTGLTLDKDAGMTMQDAGVMPANDAGSSADAGSADDGPEVLEETGCGCATSSERGGLVGVTLLLLAVLLRRRS